MSGIVFGTHGHVGADGAAHLAATLAKRLGVALEVVVAYEPLPVADYGYGIARAPTGPDEEVIRQALMDIVRDQLQRCGLSAVKPQMLTGPAVLEIARLAEAHQADMIVVGWGSHNLIDRAFGGETALRLAQNATVPVLAVSTDKVPGRVVAATDFSSTSERSISLVARWLTVGDELHLVHVIDTSGRRHRNIVAADVVVRLDALATSVSGTKGVRIVREIRQGNPARELLAYAESVRADLIALGSNGFGPLQRWVLGSVASKVMRLASTGVLVVPPTGHVTHQQAVPTQPESVFASAGKSAT